MRPLRFELSLALILVIVACGESPASDQATTSVVEATAPPTTAPTSTTTVTGSGRNWVTIEAVGTVIEDRRGLVLCPYPREACPGLPLAGSDLPGVGNDVRITGQYDGRHLTVASVESWERKELGPPTNPCTGNARDAQPPEDLAQLASDLYEDMPDRLAGTWVADGQMVVAFTGQADAETEAIADQDGVCVVTGYQYSAVELQEMIDEELMPFLDERGLYLLFPNSREVPEPEISVEGDAVDAATIEQLEERFGALVHTSTFITVLDAPVSELPQQEPAVPGDIAIPTAALRGGREMAALMAGAVLEYDEALDCLYMGGGENRQIIVWPYGYTAVSGDPATVHDPSGEVAYRTGVEFEIGGGSGSIQGVDPDLRCDAADAWYAAGPTERQLIEFREN